MKEFRYSSTETYMVCRRKFKYEYVWELEPNYSGTKPVTLADVGSAFHAGAEALYRGNDAKRRLEAYIRLHKMQGAEVKIGSAYRNSADVARECLNRYDVWRKYSQFDEGMKTVMIEEDLRMQIAPGVIIKGTPDRVDEDAYGQLHIRDYKTVGMYNKFDDYSNKNRQGLTYALLVEAATGKKVVSFTLIQIHRNPPKSNPQPVNPLTEHYEDDQKDAHRKHLALVATEMLNLSTGDLTAYPHPGEHCKWCPFKELCYAEDAQPYEFENMKQVYFRKKES